MMTLGGITMDCQDLGGMAAFWTAAAGYDRRDPEPPYLLLEHPSQSVPRLLLQQVSEAKSAKTRIHLDFIVEDLELEATRLQGLGAGRFASYSEYGMDWIVMADPEGNEFCIGHRTGS